MTTPKRQKIAALVSGGVDSSVALALLKEDGYDVHAFYLKIWLEDEVSFLGECPWEEDLRYVRAVCEALRVPLTVVPFQKEYRERVVSYVLDETRAGRTPNPDMLCNPKVKFGAFLDFLSLQKNASFNRVATGHYAQTKHDRGKTHLLRSADPVKDQTYFLSQLSQEQVSHALFPIGHLPKTEVRALAKKFNLPNAERKDSQGICFLGKVRFDAFLEHYLGKQSGDIVEYETGKKLGTHDGYWFFTIGQRKGIKLSGGPWFVVAKDIQNNVVFVSNRWRNDSGARDSFFIESMNWIAGVPSKKRSFSVKIRHGEREYECRIRRRNIEDEIWSMEDGRWIVGGIKNEERWMVKMDESDAGIAAGQFAVLYDGEECVGGGVIRLEL